MKEKIVLGTSIAPMNIEWQISCIRSWIINGFNVISCNTSEEIEILKPLCAGIKIEFEEVECSLNTVKTKALPNIHDILMHIWKKTEHIGGFINSDIYIDNMSEEMYEFIVKETMNSFLFVQRYEIDSIADIKKLNWDIHFDGIDMFLLDKKYIPTFFNDGFFVQSCWDACILLKAKMQEIQIKQLMNPIVFHKRHSQKWDFKISNILIENFWNKYFYTKERAYEKTIRNFYDILLEYCEQVCFLDSKNVKCLFVTKDETDVFKKSIKKQEFFDFDISIQNSDINKENYNYVFYVPRNVKLSSVFCKTIIFVMTICKCSKLEVGRFFVSVIDGERHYSNLNKSIELLEYINEKINSNILVNALEQNGMHGKILCPIVHEEIDINNINIISKLKIQGTYYIAPAGIRANRWYEEDGYKLCDMKLLGFLDNNKNGELEFGRIFPMEIIKENQEAYVFVASKYYVKEIVEQLEKIIDINRIINVGLICYIDEKGIIYYFDINQYESTYKKLT